MSSVLQTWVTALPLREQGTLVVALRGCDLAPKHPLDSQERQLTAWVRWCVLNPADPREIDYRPGCFMQSQPPTHLRLSSIAHYPMHWVMHLIVTLEVIGYRHVDQLVAEQAYALYLRLVHDLHLNPESFSEMVERLSEDRIASESVVS